MGITSTTTMTKARPARSPAARRAIMGIPGLKALLAASSLAVVLGGWAAIAAQPTALAGDLPAALAPLPTLAAPGGLPSRLGATAGLRSVTAPPPVAVTRSSR